MRVKLIQPIGLLAAAGFLLVAGAGTSSAATPSGSSVSQPAGQVVVVDIHAAGVVHKSDGSTFYPTGSIPSGALVVVPDDSGALPGGLTKAQFQAIAASNAAAAAAGTATARDCCRFG